MSLQFQKTTKLPTLCSLKIDEAIEEIRKSKQKLVKCSAEEATQPVYPVLIARIPKGWTGPKAWEGTPIEVDSVRTKFQSQ